MSTSVRDLVTQSLEELESDAPLAPIVERACRIARLVGDYPSLIRLSLESRGVEETERKQQFVAEIHEHLRREEAEALHAAAAREYLEERSSAGIAPNDEEDTVYLRGIAELELGERVAREALAQGWTPELATRLHVLQVILLRVRSRLQDYMSRVEAGLEVAQAGEDVFVQNRRYIESRLASLSPSTLEALQSAERRMRDAGPEERSQALTSCRRALKHLADDLYPATGEQVEGVDGKVRKMSEDKYVQRLVQYAYDHATGATDRTLLIAQLQKLGIYIDALNDLANKGVHESVTAFGVNQCVIQTFLTVGDFLRLQGGEDAPTD